MLAHQIYTAPWWDALTRRWKCLPGRDLGIYMGSVIQPTTDLDRLMDRPRLMTRTIQPGSSRDIAYFTPPVNKGWLLQAWESPVDSGAANYQRRIGVWDGPVASGTLFRLSGISTATALMIAVVAVVGGPLWIGPGWVLGMTISSWVADGAGANLNAWVLEIDIPVTRTALGSPNA